jgi:hypothetical protein
MARNPSPQVQLQRIKHITTFLNNGGGNLTELLDYVNEKLIEENLPPIKERQIQYDLNKLNSGDFAHSKKHLTKNERGNLFRYEVKNKKYQWESNSEQPVFDDLQDEERLTLPFLFGLLKRYESIPAVEKILHVVKENYNMSEKELNKDEMFVVHNITMNDIDFEEELVKVALQLIGHIQRSEVIEFNYTWVGNLDNAKNSYGYYKIAPLQVKLYENYYYLTGVNFRIDQILQLKVEPSLDETEAKTEMFDRSKLIQDSGFKDHFKYVLGVWTPSATDDVHRLTIEFKDWAASYVRHLKFHPTQRFVEMDPKKKTYTISLDLKLMPEIMKGKKVTERAPELQFLLGRFRECASIIKTKRI